MKRRKFIQSSSLVTLPLFLNGMEVTAISKSSLADLIDPDTDKVLVLVQLNGGNDGLNTVIPLDQYANLHTARENIIIPENDLLKITDLNALNPAMTDMQEMYREGKLGVVQSVSYPNQNRSHFRSKDIWTSASDSDEYITTGWLGRHFDIYHPGYPDGYPNEDYPDPFAITLGYIVSETCQGSQTNLSHAVANSNAIITLDETEPGEIDNSCYGMELTYIKDVISQSNAYSTVVGEAFNKGINTIDYPESRLAEQLKIVANLISGGLKTKVYVVSAGGYDTHANQVIGGAPSEGQHAELLAELSQSISIFQKDITNQGLGERVIGMTFSEFGRRIKSNDGFGTDHGTAAPLFVFGECVNGGVIGDNPEITDNVADNEGVPMQYDFRSIYATILMDWFDVSEDHVRTVLFDDFQHLPFLKDCSVVSETDDDALIIDVDLYPSPTSGPVNLEFESSGARTVIQLYDAQGALLKTLCDTKLSLGKQNFYFEFHDLAVGNYFIRLVEGSNQKTIKFVKA
jgi:uncharacterized protein (DUF1501 family)